MERAGDPEHGIFEAAGQSCYRPESRHASPPQQAAARPKPPRMIRQRASSGSNDNSNCSTRIAGSSVSRCGLAITTAATVVTALLALFSLPDDRGGGGTNATVDEVGTPPPPRPGDRTYPVSNYMEAAANVAAGGETRAPPFERVPPQQQQQQQASSRRLESAPSEIIAGGSNGAKIPAEVEAKGSPPSQSGFLKSSEAADAVDELGREAWVEEPTSSLLSQVLSVVGTSTPAGEEWSDAEEDAALWAGWDDGFEGFDLEHGDGKGWLVPGGEGEVWEEWVVGGRGWGEGVEGDGRRALKLKLAVKASERCFIFPKTGRQRCHANIFFFGISKCGTTSLARWIGAHPALKWVCKINKLGTPGAEAHVFDNKREVWHHILKAGRHGEYGITAPDAVKEDPVLDYTPHYATMAEVPYRIMDRYGSTSYDGSVKYVVLLREPAARTISSWQFKFELKSLEKGYRGRIAEGRSLKRAFEDGKAGVNKLLACREALVPQLADGPADLLVLDLIKCNPRKYLEKNMYMAHVGKSMYALQLERWFTLFGRENIKVLFLEDMAVDPVGMLEEVFDFVGMDMVDEEGEKGLTSREEWEDVVTTNHNEADGERKEILKDQVTPEITQEIRDFFAPHNAHLATLLGRPLPSSWSMPPDDSGERKML